MSCSHIAWVRQQRGLSHVQRLVLGELTARANGERYCFPSIELLASDIEASERAVIRAVNYLSEERSPPLIAKVTDQSERVELLTRAGAKPTAKVTIYRVLRPSEEETASPPPDHMGDVVSPSPDHIGDVKSPSTDHEGDVVSPMRVNSGHHMGDVVSPEESMKKEEEEAARARAREPEPGDRKNPANGYGPQRWTDSRIVPDQLTGRPCVNGTFLDTTIARLTEAADATDGTYRLTEPTVIQLLADGYEPEEMCAVIRKIGERGHHSKPMAYYARAIRETRPTWKPIGTWERKPTPPAAPPVMAGGIFA